MCCILIFIAQYDKFFDIWRNLFVEKFKFVQIDLYSIRRITIQIKTIKFSPPNSGKTKRFSVRKNVNFKSFWRKIQPKK